MPTPVHLGRCQEEEEEEQVDNQEIISSSTPKQGTGSTRWSALYHKVDALLLSLEYNAYLEPGRNGLLSHKGNIIEIIFPFSFFL